MAEEKVSLSRSAGIISFASAISRVTGLLNIFVVAMALDWGRLQDSYNLANVMPNMLFELVAGGILTSLFIPIFISARIKDEHEGWRIASNITNITLLFLAAIALTGTVFSYWFVRTQTFLVPTAKVSVAEVNFFFKFFVWEIFFYGLTAVLNGILQSYRRFTAPAFAPIVNNLVAIGAILFFYIPLKETQPVVALYGLAVGTTLGVAGMALVQLPALFKLGFKYTFVFNLRERHFRELLLLAVPIVAYVISNQIGLTVANALAWKYDGGLTAFTYAWRFFQMPYGLLAVAISTVLFPGFSEQAAVEDRGGFKQTLLVAVRTTAFIIIPVSFALFVLSKPVISLIFLRAIGVRGVDQTSGVMAYFMVGLLPFSLYMLLTRVFYALKDTVTPMKVNAVGIPLNIALDFLLVDIYGVKGLSMAHSLTYLFTMSVLFWSLRQRIGGLNGRVMLASAMKFILISLLMTAPITALSFWAGGWVMGRMAADALLIAAATIVGALVYLGVNKLTHTEEVNLLTRMVKGLLGKEGPDGFKLTG